MKNIGIVRSIDKVGRIVLPIEIRKQLHLMGDDAMVEIIPMEDEIVIKRYNSAHSCVLCHAEENLLDFDGQKICRICADKISKL